MLSLFEDRAQAEAAVRELKDAGFTDGEIGTAMEDTAPSPDRVEPATLDGGLISLLGTLLVPGIGPLLLGGTMASALAASARSTVTAGLADALMEAGVTKRDAYRVQEGLEQGDVLVTVTSASRIAEATAIIQRHQPVYTNIGTLGGAVAPEPSDRRGRLDPGYSGPERRLASI